jgi:hypothetical protein
MLRLLDNALFLVIDGIEQGLWRHLQRAGSCCLQGCASVAAGGALETVTTTRGSDIMFGKDY